MNDEYEKTRAQIQDDIIGSISKYLADKYPFIRFWTPEERISDEEILKQYEHKPIYSFKVTYTYPKGAKVPSVDDLFQVDFKDCKGRLFETIHGPKDSKVLEDLRIWSRLAAREVFHYFRKEELYYLRNIRFDFLPENDSRTTFSIPNLPLENIGFSPKENGDLISTEEYIKSKIIPESVIRRLLESSRG